MAGIGKCEKISAERDILPSGVSRLGLSRYAVPDGAVVRLEDEPIFPTVASRSEVSPFRGEKEIKANLDDSVKDLERHERA